MRTPPLGTAAERLCWLLFKSTSWGTSQTAVISSLTRIALTGVTASFADDITAVSIFTGESANRSYGHTPNWALVPEDQYFAHSGMNGPEHPMVRGDIVYFSTPKGGAMFSAPSMSWCASLSHNDYENNVSQLTANVLKRFADDAPMDMVT